MGVRQAYRFSSRFHLVAILSLLFLLDGFGLWLAAKLDYERTFDRTQIILQKTAGSLEERVKRTIIATDLILQSIAERIQERGIEETISSKSEWERFRNYAEALPDAGSLWLLNNKADLLMDSTQYPSQPMNFSEREYFIPQRDKGIESYIGPVVKGKITKKYSFTISRRVNGKDGSFLGIVLAAMETDDFTHFLRNINIGEGGAVTVWRTDGALILRQPMEDRQIGKNFRQLKLFDVRFEESPSGSYVTDTTVDEVERLVAYHKIKGLPLVAVTSVPMGSIKQEWHAHVRNYSLIAIIVLVALLGLSWLVYKSTSKEEMARRELVRTNEALKSEIIERKQTEEALQKSEAQLRHLSTSLLTIQERERKQISQELHDNIWQTLMTIKMDIANRKVEGETIKTESILSLIQNTIETLRKMQGDLWPYPLEDLGLFPTIDWFCREFQKHNSGIVVEKRMDLSEGDVPGSLKIFIHRVIQETLDNISKHSHANHVSLSLGRVDGKIELTIKDNGIGFNLEEIFASKELLAGLGLMSMRGQVEHSGGYLKIESGKGKGTIVRASWPLSGNN